MMATESEPIMNPRNRVKRFKPGSGCASTDRLRRNIHTVHAAVHAAGWGARNSKPVLATYPVQVPHTAFLLVVFLQGVIAMELPAEHTHTHTRKAQNNLCHKAALLSQLLSSSCTNMLH